MFFKRVRAKKGVEEIQDVFIAMRAKKTEKKVPECKKERIQHAA